MKTGGFVCWTSRRVGMFCLFFGVCLSFIVPAQAALHYVNGSCSFDGDGTSKDCASAQGGVGAHVTIQQAINATASGDIVKIVPYQYAIDNTVTTYFENLAVSKELTIETDTSSLPETLYIHGWLVIDGDAQEAGEEGYKVGDNGDATITWSGGVGGTLRNVTITGGYYCDPMSEGTGAALVISGKGTDVLVKNSTIRGNDYGLVVKGGANPTIVANYIFNNDRSGITVWDDSSPIIGEGTTWEGNPKLNEIYLNSESFTRDECPSIGGSACERPQKVGCGAIDVLDSATPKILGNEVYSNKFHGVNAQGQSVPYIRGNNIYYNGGAGVSATSTGGAIEIDGNRIVANDRGISVKGNGDTCNKVKIRNNNIRRHGTSSGVHVCNAYALIGGSAQDGNDFVNNRHGIFTYSESDGYDQIISNVEISYNNLVNNRREGIGMILTSGTVEKNLFADNNQSDLSDSQLAIASSTLQRLNNNLLVGGNYTNGKFAGDGIIVDRFWLSGISSTLEEVKGNIIYRVDAGIRFLSGSPRPGAVDRNLLMQWTNSDADGYILGNNLQPGPNTYYYGQESGSYGNPPAYLFRDPDHELSGTYPDFLLSQDVNSPVYTISDYAGNPPVDYLGLPSDFEYLDGDGAFKKYRFRSTVAGFNPTLDVTEPVVDLTVPSAGASGISSQQPVRIVIKDTGDGIDQNTVTLSLSGGTGACDPCSISINVNNSYLEVVHEATALDFGTTYTVTVDAADMQGNSLSGPGAYSFDFTTVAAGSVEYVAPKVNDLTPDNGAVDVAVDSTVQFKVRDTGFGVNPDTIQLYLNAVQAMNLEKTILTDGIGLTPDYLVYYQPESVFSGNSVVDVKIYAKDYAGNPANGDPISETDFTTAEAPVDPCPGCPSQPDLDNDGIGDACDDDIDGDCLLNEDDPCPYDADCDDDGLPDGTCSPGEDLNNNGIVDPGETDPLNPDSDGDGIQDGTEMGLVAPIRPDAIDPDNPYGFVFIPDADPTTTTDPTKADSDNDGLSDGAEDINKNGQVDEGETDAVNPDSDGDGVNDGSDVFPLDPGEFVDIDSDGVGDNADNCPNVENPGQANEDGDSLGDACDTCDDRTITLDASPSIDILWPPNHEMVSITINVKNMEPNEPDTTVRITNVEIWEYSNKEAAGTDQTNIYDENSHEPDVEITGDLTLRLRSDRAGKSSGRTYKIEVAATANGCSYGHTFYTEVTVPHDKQ